MGAGRYGFCVVRILEGRIGRRRCTQTVFRCAHITDINDVKYSNIKLAMNVHVRYLPPSLNNKAHVIAQNQLLFISVL